MPTFREVKRLSFAQSHTLQGTAESAGAGNGIAQIDNKNARPTSGQAENSRLTDTDLPEYISTGIKQTVRNEKGKMLKGGDSPILTTSESIKAFIRNAVSGKITNTIRGYGKVGSRLANAVAKADVKINAGKNGGDPIRIDGYYLELESNHLAHLADHMETDLQGRNIPLTEKQIESIPEYIDNATDVIDVMRRKDGSIRVELGTKVNGYSVIIECVSKGRKSLHPVTAWAMDTVTYESRYKNKKTTSVDTSHTPYEKDDVRHMDINRSDLNATIPFPAAPVKLPELETRLSWRA